MKLHTWGLPEALRRVGLRVVETNGWTMRSHGELPPSPTVVWHHDASPPGDSPGALAWMVSNWSKASAQIWINRAGAVHLVGTGQAWHAGAVRPGQMQFGNNYSVGIETDHTVREPWPDAQLRALRLVTATILQRGSRDESALSFHSAICQPPGRKIDPDGLNLAAERQAVGQLLRGGIATLAPTAAAATTTSPAPAVREQTRPQVPPFPGTMRRGSRAPSRAAILALQQRLALHGKHAGRPWDFSSGPGTFGPRTEEAVRWFQRVSGRGLSVDGVCGEKTWRELWL